MDKFKDRIRDFWNKKPCGTFGIIPENVDRDYFDNIKKRRYFWKSAAASVLTELNLQGPELIIRG